MDTINAVEAILSIDTGARALQFGGSWLTYGDLGERIATTRGSLRRAGVSAGATVATVLPNRPEGLVAMLSVLLERACMVTISPRQQQLELARAPSAVALLAPDGVTPTGASPKPRAGVAVLIATSGTTGAPKRIPLTYATIDGVVAGVRGLAGGGGRGPALRDDTTLICFPYTNLSGLLPQLIALVSGRRTALLDRFEPNAVATLVAEHAMTSLALNPTAMRMLLDAHIDPELLRTVRYVRSGSAPLNPDLAARFEDEFGVGVLQSYGQTEVGGEIVGWSSQDHRDFGTAKRGSVGRPHPGVELRIVAPGETPDAAPAATASPGGWGELWVRGARNVKGWHRTGDLARIDGDGFVWLDGRTDGLIICGGFNIVPAALERVLEQHPSVIEAAVVARPDERLGEIPVALVVLQGDDVDVDELVEHCRSQLEPYQVPRRVLAVEELPRTELGKLHLPSARALAASAPVRA